jgi:hypothetical protein
MKKLTVLLTLPVVFTIACAKHNEGTGGQKSEYVCPQPVSFNGLTVFRDTSSQRLLYQVNLSKNWDQGSGHGRICLSKQNGDELFFIHEKADKRKFRYATHKDPHPDSLPSNVTPPTNCPAKAALDEPAVDDMRDVDVLGDISGTPSGCQYKTEFFFDDNSKKDPHIAVGK